MKNPPVADHVVIPLHWPGEFEDLLSKNALPNACIHAYTIADDRMHLLISVEEDCTLDEVIKDLLLQLPEHLLPDMLDFFSFSLPDEFVRTAHRFMTRQRERLIPQSFAEEMQDLLDLYEIPFREEEVAEFCSAWVPARMASDRFERY